MFKSKKGFTLVELVVVIAILGILAAIAIPNMLNIIREATESASESNAAELDSACKDFYAGVVSGAINSSNASTKVSGYALPSKTATVSYKKSAAGNLEVNAAVKYAGLTSKFTTDSIKNYSYINNEGTVVFNDTSELAVGTGAGKRTLLSLSVKFGDMYPES